ncbi:MAG: hypothetical protein ACI4QE_03535 [Acutalibacteraceae bacterium]
MRKLNVTQLQIGDKVYLNQLKEIYNIHIVVILTEENQEGRFGYVAYKGNDLNKFVEQRIKQIDPQAFFFYERKEQ